MRVNITLLGELKDFAPGTDEDFQLDLEPGADLEGLLQGLGINPQRKLIMLINGRQARQGQILSDADHLTLLPALEGG